MKVWVSPCLTTTPHIGDEDELVTADHADNKTEQPEQAAQAENAAPPDPADEAEPDEVEQDEVPREMGTLIARTHRIQHWCDWSVQWVETLE